MAKWTRFISPIASDLQSHIRIFRTTFGLIFKLTDVGNEVYINLFSSNILCPILPKQGKIDHTQDPEEWPSQKDEREGESSLLWPQ